MSTLEDDIDLRTHHETLPLSHADPETLRRALFHSAALAVVDQMHCMSLALLAK